MTFALAEYVKTREGRSPALRRMAGYELFFAAIAGVSSILVRRYLQLRRGHEVNRTLPGE